jgi:hypothetical protein
MIVPVDYFEGVRSAEICPIDSSQGRAYHSGIPLSSPQHLGGLLTIQGERIMLKRLTRKLLIFVTLCVPLITVSSAPAASPTVTKAGVVCVKTLDSSGQCVIVCDDGTAYGC